jgi:hypothetical protein
VPEDKPGISYVALISQYVVKPDPELQLRGRLIRPPKFAVPPEHVLIDDEVVIALRPTKPGGFVVLKDRSSSEAVPSVVPQSTRSTSMSKITNTQAKFDSPLRRLQGLMPGGHGGAIEAMEAEGQAELVKSSQFPSKFNGNPEEEKKARDLFGAAGMKWGEPTTGDEIFCQVELPKDWKLVRTDHAMWSELLDDKGRKRASIFYKAAFYDRSAFWNAAIRYNVKVDYSSPVTNGLRKVHVVRDEQPVVTFEVDANPLTDAYAPAQGVARREQA